MAKQNGEGQSEEYMELLRDVGELKEKLRVERTKNKDTDLSTLTQKEEEVSLISPVMAMKPRKVLKGHRGRVLHFSWSPDKNHILTAGQDGLAVIWDAFNSLKEVIIQTQTPQVLACSYSPSTTLVACGGLDNQCSIYKVDDRMSGDGLTGRITMPKKTLAQHTKHITHCAFFGSDQQLLTSSADHSCALWDMEQSDPVQVYKGHRSEVLGLATHPRDIFTVFASGSADHTACVWDARSGRCEMMYENQEGGDVNAVRFFPSGEALATACSDGSLHLYDLRADQEIKFYTKPSIVFGASSLDFSKSGHILFAGYDDYSVRAWDVLKGNFLTLWLHHQERVSHLQLSPDGTALGTSSWDGTVRIWA